MTALTFLGELLLLHLYRNIDDSKVTSAQLPLLATLNLD